MPYTEFYCDAGSGSASNLNAGSTTGAAVYTSTNGGWNSGTGVFTPTSGNPSLTVSVGDFASVYLDAASVTGFVGRVTNVSSTTITVSITAKSGTIPTTSGAGLTCKVGGVWKGPNAAEGFPFNFITSAQTNAAGDFPRVNFKSGTNYAITAAMTHANNGPIRFQGYTSSPGDFGRATIDGGTSLPAYALLTLSGSNCDLLDFAFQNNGASGVANGILTSGAEIIVGRCVFSNVRAAGLFSSSIGLLVFECECFLSNQSGTLSSGGFAVNNSTTFVRCISHDHPVANSCGFSFQGGSFSTLIDCIADTVNGQGFLYGGSVGLQLFNCDAYNNGSDGVRLANSSASVFYIENCNFIKNGGYGVNGSTAQPRNGTMINCAFGTGTQANTSGTTTGLSGMNELGSINYSAGVTPWVDPANGDFRVNLAAARGVGRGSFTQTQASYSGTIAYPDIGAAQHQESGGGKPIIGMNSPVIRGLVA